MSRVRIRKGSPIWWLGVIIGASLVVLSIMMMFSALVIIS
jgi:hypothetical protein